ncbi:MAG: hypothetical protein JWQ21_2615 [Herminiimonas sp.]|nr:hypothetical protein [Herminiimonas sp.]
MKYLLTIVFAICSFAAYGKDDPEQTKREIGQHRAIAAAHEAAAKCMESGKDEEVCNAELAKACKGIAIGKFCGMKHSHGEP